METSKHTKILLLFLGGIGFPCLLLGHLAYRGIRNDQALRERELLNQHRKRANLIVKVIHDSISAIEQNFLQAATRFDARRLTLGGSAWDTLKIRFPLIAEIFFWENSGKLGFPAAEVLFVADSGSKAESQEMRSTDFAAIVQEGQQLEFQQNDDRAALAFYQQALARASGDQIKAELLNAIARVQKKLGRFPDAIKTCNQLTRDYSQARIAGGLPLGLTARLERGDLFLATNDSLRALQTFLEAYTQLVNGEWELEKSQYDFFGHQVVESIATILARAKLPASWRAHHAAFEELQEKEKQRRAATVKLLAFQQKVAAFLSEKNAHTRNNHQHAAQHFVLNAGDHNYLIALLKLPTESNAPVDTIWGLWLDANHLKAHVLRAAMQAHLPAVSAGWIVRDKNGNVLAKSAAALAGTPVVKTEFSEKFPPWSLELYRREPAPFEALFSSERSIYFYVFVLIAGILIFGLTLTLRSVNHELELARLKSDFVSTISHDFKSPLTSIRQLAEMLQTGRVPSESRRRQYYDALVEQSERLSILIDNVLDFAKMEEGRKMFAFELMDISGLLREIVARMQHSHEGFQIHAQIPEPLPAVNVDRLAISQAMTNLLDNAIKYSGDANRIEVRAFAENQHLVIIVQDYGIGIEKGDIGKIFDRFYRGGDPLLRMVKGTGLGLMLVKQIVKAHHGAVQVESEPGWGSTFTIRLPLQQA
ncbi:ATP-binding protein [candidate division KSB1 bacterium]|nr:ATP-binding protein [candidate division KSB1 bacterium]